MAPKDEYTIDSESQYNGIRDILSKQTQRPGVLRLLMRAMERYRSTRKYGWSRPWNKDGVLNTLSLRVRPCEDLELISESIRILENECIGIPEEVISVVHELLLDQNHLMGFLFVQEITDSDGSSFEALTISLGRVQQKRYRDRLDIILESPVVDNKSTGLQRIRVFVDPYDEGRKEPLWTFESNAIHSKHTQHTFEALSAVTWAWANKRERVWSHWTSRYIDYFGERQWPLNRCFLFHPEKPESRIPTLLPLWADEDRISQAC
ncbi:MAG: hypothetical protein OEZ43_16480 [Gammaproteobacteria bacterium]|nr:hypothetical protein [Gammaproteobacteria bacterium]